METTRRPDWKRLLEGKCASSPQLLRYATDPREGDCLRLLPTLRRGRALFLGNALAIMPTILADQFESVVVADSNDERLVAAEQRRDTQAFGKLTCVRITGAEEVAARLGQFDLLVLGEERPDLAAWLPFSDSDVPQQLARAIVAGGWLMYGVRFPRLHALTYCRSARRAPLFYPAHARLLEAAGFTDVRPYGRWPQRRPYQFYIPLDDAAPIAYWLGKTQRPIRLRRRVRNAAKAILRRLGASPYLFNNFLITARRVQ